MSDFGKLKLKKTNTNRGFRDSILFILIFVLCIVTVVTIQIRSKDKKGNDITNSQKVQSSDVKMESEDKSEAVNTTINDYTQSLEVQKRAKESLDNSTDKKQLNEDSGNNAISAKTDFLKKTEVSVNLMAHIVYLWIRLKSPLNRVATSLAEYGIRLSRQQLYKNVGITADMLMPIFKRMEYYIQEEVRLLLDETYYACREKLRLCISPPEDDKGKSKAKKQRSLSKSMRSYFYGIVGDLICLYYHDLDRNSDIPKDILISNNVRDNAFVETDGFYRKSFNLSTNEDDNTQTELFKHGVCYVHLKRYFCVLLNYATKTDGTPIAEFIECKWEQDIEDSKRICDKISNAFHVCNKITKRCDEDKSLDIVALKHEELRPLIDEIFTDIRTIYDDINCKKGEKARRSCSKKFRDAIKYAINNEAKLKTFLDSPYGLMSSTKVEEKFRELDILRNGMLASDTCKGAENLALFYSLYKTAQMHGIEFETYLQKAITVMTEHLDEIEFEKDHRGTIIGYKSHSISDEILDKLMPWNMAQKQ